MPPMVIPTIFPTSNELELEDDVAAVSVLDMTAGGWLLVAVVPVELVGVLLVVVLGEVERLTIWKFSEAHPVLLSGL